MPLAQLDAPAVVAIRRAAYASSARAPRSVVHKSMQVCQAVRQRRLWRAMRVVSYSIGGEHRAVTLRCVCMASTNESPTLMTIVERIVVVAAVTLNNQSSVQRAQTGCGVQ